MFKKKKYQKKKNKIVSFNLTNNINHYYNFNKVFYIVFPSKFKKKVEYKFINIFPKKITCYLLELIYNNISFNKKNIVIKKYNSESYNNNYNLNFEYISITSDILYYLQLSGIKKIIPYVDNTNMFNTIRIYNRDPIIVNNQFQTSYNKQIITL